MSDAIFTETINERGPAAGELKPGWRVVRFGDVVRNVDVSERQPLEQGLERYVGLDHLDPESLHIKRWGLIEEGTSFTRKFVRGQVLFGKRRAYQRKAAVAEFDGICSGDILVFEPKGDELLPELLPFIVQSDGFFEHALGTSAGSLSPRTKWSDLACYEFALPPKDEQRRIADILWAAEDAIEAWNEVNDQLGKVQEALSIESFSNNDNHEKSVLKSLTLKIGSGKTPRGGERVYRQSGVVFLRSQNIYPDGLHLDDVTYISEDIDAEMASTRVKKNDVLLNITGASIGRCTIYNRTDAANVNQHVCIIRTVLDKLNPLFLTYFLQSRWGQDLISKFSTKGNREGLNFQQLGSFQIPLLLLADQNIIVQKFKAIDNARIRTTEQLDKLMKVKKEMLYVLLSGVGTCNVQ